MTEPQSTLERMESLGWHFVCDINESGELVVAAYKLRPISPGLRAAVSHYHTDQKFKDDLLNCMAAHEAAE